ncbi:MAG TPA: lysine 2,3-aminomutase [Verrucomicrobiales bacterium]|nr:KamA family radical SAM protein [Verrucomicrobiae bacterium]RZO73978.1 MAG: KamA family radical SAM protein [Limisphaerales bacterium]HAO65583.1 lysine 2,3-aminomutase [Verrucomicrobiales bacterium]HAW01059.1 lysine 2,3-aminomutase [Verrucomicrobiales bacterium]HBP56932.1 lysine 2,3-aminomutase [Verrucomicrobiales bacterium]|tara:strand:- start:2752 stop:3990 length:1239 start_codon:yes stop_codon:yes gene_type:complete
MANETYPYQDPAQVSELLSSHKRFTSGGRGPWHAVSDSDWQDWRWQLKNRINNLDQLESVVPDLSDEEIQGAELANTKLSLGITPYFSNLIHREDPICPIRRQVVPRVEETVSSAWDMSDPCGEDEHSPVPGLVHRYPDRVLFLVTDRCAAYCRYCTRSRLVSNASGYGFQPDYQEQLDYIRKHPEVRDVLFSGGDPLLLSDSKLEGLLKALRDIPHVEFIRIGSRIPIFLPQRITSDLCEMLKQFHPLFMSVHANHPRELTTEVKEALGRLADAGIPLGNQSVLLRGVNDSVPVMKALIHKLLMCRVRPYYLYQCDLISGSAHLRTSVRKGLEIMRGLRGHTTGYAVPQYVIDAPGGGGKVPINPEYILSHNNERVVIRNFEGRVFEYPEVADEPEDASSMKVCSSVHGEA